MNILAILLQHFGYVYGTVCKVVRCALVFINSLNLLRDFTTSISGHALINSLNLLRDFTTSISGH